MRPIVLSLVAALGLVFAPGAEACVELVSPAMVVIDHFDPFGGSGSVRSFPLTLAARGSASRPVYAQFIDRRTRGRAHQISGLIGPYRITAANGHEIVSDIGDLRAPNAAGIDGTWTAFALSGPGNSEMQTLSLQIDPSTQPAGIYDESLDLRVACPRTGGGFDYVTIPNALDLRVAVDNVVKIVGSRSLRIDLGELTTDGPAAKGMATISLLASGPYDLRVRSTSADHDSLHRGLLIREGAASKPGKADQIPYGFQIGGLGQAKPDGDWRCPGSNKNLTVAVATDPVPGASKNAGNYRDVLEVTITPNFYGGSVGEGFCRAD